MVHGVILRKVVRCKLWMYLCGSYDLNSLKMHAYNKILQSLQPLEWLELKEKSQKTSVGVDVQKSDSMHCWWKCKIAQPL